MISFWYGAAALATRVVFLLLLLAAGHRLSRAATAPVDNDFSVKPQPSADTDAALNDLIRLCPPDGLHFRLLTARAPGWDDDTFRVRVDPADASVLLQGATPTATRFAATWFCQRLLGVRWFLPTTFGEVAPEPPARERLLQPLDVTVQPAFISRVLGGLTWPNDPSAGAEWAAHNLLHDRLAHGHALLQVIPSSLYPPHPDYFPHLDHAAATYRPESAGDYNWQPALTNPGVVAQTGRYVAAYFQLHPAAPAISLCINDSIRFDTAPESLAARGPLRWFRHRPDYSDLVFGYMNRVADSLPAILRNKELSAYAYYWCENTPTFPVRPQVLPWLTADRTQGYDPAFQREDEDLIRRWCHSGARIVGTYDYLYGAPFLVPRVTPHLIARAIRVEHEAGVRAFTAEADAHWAYDAPKLWLAAQLLQDPQRAPDALLTEFYRSFFGASAAPMQRFYERCEAAWMAQPPPARWIKYYQDIDQALLFPPAVRAALAKDLADADAQAGDVAVAARVAFVRAAFRVTEAFCAYQAAGGPNSSPSAGPAAEAKVAAGAEPIRSAASSPGASVGDDHQALTQALTAAFQQAVRIGAMAPFDLAIYTRVTEADARAEPSGPPDGDWTPAPLQDPTWRTLPRPAPALDDTTFTWANGPWLARGEPSEFRKIDLPWWTAATTVRYRGAAGERISQWVAAVPGTRYRAEVQFRGQVTAGSEAYLIISFTNAAGAFVGPVVQRQVRPGRYPHRIALDAEATAPAGAARLGFGIYLYHQEPGDVAEFSRARLWQGRAQRP